METVIENKKLQGYYQLAYHGYVNTSFSPEDRARRTIDEHSEELIEDLAAIKAFNPDADLERYETGYIKKFAAWLGARSRCISSMITGPANFPVRRAEKANDMEHRRSVEFMDWRKKVLHKLTTPESTDIVRGSEGAIDKMNAKLEGLETHQETMKAVNKVLRDKQENKHLRIMELGFTEEATFKLMYPPARLAMFGTGFPHFDLTNNGAAIRNLKKDIKAETNRLARYTDGNKEYELELIDTPGTVKVVENVEANRLQLIFEGKPVEDVRKELRSRGYRWSPRYNAWQRQLTNNALYSLKQLYFIKPNDHGK